MTDTFNPPPLPDPTRAAQWAGQIRAFMPLIGGILAAFGVAIPTLTDTQITGYIYAVMVLAGLGLYIWAALLSWWAKIHDRKVLVASAIASATKGMPVTITVTPGFQPNIAKLVSATEIANAPPVPRGAPQSAA